MDEPAGCPQIDWTAFQPALDIIKLDATGPWLEGSACSQCDVVIPGLRRVCPSCGGRDTVVSKRLPNAGTLYNFTIVHRSFPGVETPFIYAVIDLDGGGSLKGVLRGVDPDPVRLERDARIRIVFGDTRQQTSDGTPFLGYFFELAKGATA